MSVIFPVVGGVDFGVLFVGVVFTVVGGVSSVGGIFSVVAWHWWIWSVSFTFSIWFLSYFLS